MDLLAHITAFARRHPGPYVVAVSGGVDSMVLLDLLAPFRPIVAHYDHAVREGSARDAEFVAEAAAARGLAFASARRSGGGVSEAELRGCRRAFLESVATEHGARIVTAHHASDQLETFLLRVMRGTGIDGLGAMRESAGLWLRPLLSVPRTAIEAHARARAIAFREDSTNREEIYLRNRLRARVVPALHELADSKFTARFAATLAELQGIADELSALTENVYRSLAIESPFWVRVPAAAWASLAEPMRGRILRRIASALGAETPDRDTIARVCAALAEERRGAEGVGFSVRASCDQLFFRRAELTREFRFERCDSEWRCSDLGWRLRGIEELYPGAEVRFFRPGDRANGRKLKEHFLDLRIPEPERALLPVVATGDQVHAFFPHLSTHHITQAPDIAWSFSSDIC